MASVLEVEDQIDASGDFGIETIDKKWTRDDLTPYVEANANVLVRCPWMQGAEMTVMQAMWNYPNWGSITEETQDIAISAVDELLANRVIETEEPAEEDEPVEPETVKNEKADKKINTNSETQKKPEIRDRVTKAGEVKQEIDAPKNLEPPIARVEKPATAHRNVVNREAGVAVEPVAGEPKPVSQGAAEAEVAASPSKSFERIASGDVTGAPEVLAVTGITSVISALEPVTRAKQQVPTLAIPKLEATPSPIVEEMPAPDRPQLVVNPQIESHTLPVPTEAAAKDKTAELPPLDFERAAILDNNVQLGDEKIVVVEEEPELATFDYQMSVSGLISFVEDNSGAATEAPVFQLGEGLNPPEQTVISSPEQLVLISAGIEEVEASLIQLTEQMRASEPEMTERMNEILDKIIEVPAKLEVRSSENIITEAEAQAELEELFTTLLDKAGIDYTPELIESLVYLTLKWRLADEIGELKSEEETEGLPQHSCTHEIIKKLLVGLSIIKKAMTHASIIGKSALRLYSFNFAT